MFILKGVSTQRKKRSRLLKALGNPSFLFFRITKELDEKVEEFLSKPIEHEIHYLLIDATYFKVIDSLHYENKAFM
jgi:putative transposase